MISNENVTDPCFLFVFADIAQKSQDRGGRTGAESMDQRPVNQISDFITTAYSSSLRLTYIFTFAGLQVNQSRPLPVTHSRPMTSGWIAKTGPQFATAGQLQRRWVRHTYNFWAVLSSLTPPAEWEDLSHLMSHQGNRGGDSSRAGGTAPVQESLPLAEMSLMF